MQIAEDTSALLIKISRYDKLSANKEKVTWLEPCEKICKECSLSQLDSIIPVRQMVDNRQLIPEEGNLILNFYLYKNENEFQKTQKALQDPCTTTKPITLLEGKVLTILSEEEKSIHDGINNENGTNNNEEEGNDLIATNGEEQFRGRKRKKQDGGLEL